MRYYSSVASSKVLNALMSDSTTSMTLNNTTGLPTNHPYTLVIEPDTGNEEIVLVTATAGTTLTVVRGTNTYADPDVGSIQGGNGTQAREHAQGSVVKHMVTARDLQEPQNHIAAATVVHGLASGEGAVVGADKTQTLTNKSLTSPALTGTPTAPTATTGTNTTQIATTAFVQDAVNTTNVYTYMYSNSATTSSASTDIAFANEVFDTALAHSTSVDTWKWLPTVAGTYMFTCVIEVTNSTASSKLVNSSMVKNTSAFGPRVYLTLPANSEGNITLTGIASFNGSSDYAKVIYYGDTSGNTTYQAYWTIIRLGS